MFKIIFYLLIIISILTACSNEEKIDRPDKTSNLKAQYDKNRASVDSLTNEMESLTNIRDSLEIEYSLRTQPKQISEIVSQSKFDHLNIIVNSVQEVKQYFEKLGFKIKYGTNHPNGIYNCFLKLNDNTELEFIEINDPTDSLSRFYFNREKEEKSFGMIAFNNNKIEELHNFYDQTKITNDYIINKIFSTLDFGTGNQLPFFFINYFNKPTNTKYLNNELSRVSELQINTEHSNNIIANFAQHGFELVLESSNPINHSFSGRVILSNFQLLIKTGLEQKSKILIKAEYFSKIKKAFLEQNLDENDKTISILENEIILSPEFLKNIEIRIEK